LYNEGDETLEHVAQSGSGLLETFKARMDKALSNLIQLMSLLTAGGLG